MSNLHKSKRYDLIVMFNDTSLYFDDIFTIDNPIFEKHIPDIYPLYILTTYSPSITLYLRNIFLIYIQRNFS